MNLKMKTKRCLVGLGFVSPFIIGLFLIFIPSFIKATIFSFFDIIMKKDGYELVNVGIKYYQKALTGNAWFTQELIETVWQMLLNVPLIIAFSFFVSCLVNRKFKGRAFVRMVLFLPVIVSTGVILKVDTTFSGMSEVVQDSEMMNAIASFNIVDMFLKIGLPESIAAYISEAMARIYEIITQSGVQILVLLAALQTISPSLYEASTMEGATAWENFWKVTFPMLSPYLLTCAVYTIIDSLSSYTSPVLSVITDTAQGTNANLSYSIAMSFIFFGVALVILAIFGLIFSRKVFYNN